MFEGSWILKLNTPYFEFIQQSNSIFQVVAPVKRIKNSMLPSGTSWIFQFHHVNQFHCRLTQLRYCMAIPDDEATLWKAHKSFTANLQKILLSLEIFLATRFIAKRCIPVTCWWAIWSLQPKRSGDFWWHKFGPKFLHFEETTFPIKKVDVNG